MSYNNFTVPDSGYSAAVTEDLDNALSESGIPAMELANALASRPSRRRPAPTPSGGVTKARQAAPGGCKARQRKTAEGGPLKRISKACLTCRRAKVKCGGEQPSCGRCSGKPQPCRYDYTEKEHAAHRAAAEHSRRRRDAIEMVASAPHHRCIQPRLEGPVTALGELAAVPVLSPPLPEQTMQSQIQPVQSTPDLFGLDRFTPTQYLPTNYTQTNYTPADCTAANYTPTTYTPTSYTPTSYTPTSYTPSSYTATTYTPTNYTPTQFTPTQLNPAQIGQDQFNPTHFGETLGNWDPRQKRTSQYPLSESMPYDRFQHPQESRFGQGDLSQLSSGALQYHGAFDSTHGAPVVQPDWNTPYVNYQNMVRPSVPIWSETGLPARSVPWSEPVSNDFGLGSINNAQTPAESSHHVERARSLASMAAMMPPLEDEWA